MIKINKKGFIFILLLFLSILMPSYLYATELNSIEVFVNLLENGDGEITMVWDYNDDYGTEHYIPINGRGIKIENLKVSKNGTEYSILDSWDVNASRENKKNKAGIIFDGANYELCWGIGDYGNNKFNVSYTVKDIIKNLEDAQMLHYRFINDNLSESPDYINMEIKGFKDFNKEDVLMWGFGFDGEIMLKDNIISVYSNSILNYDDYVNVLLRFEPGYFNANPDSYVDSTFEEVQDLAFIGSDYNNNTYNSNNYNYNYNYNFEHTDNNNFLSMHIDFQPYLVLLAPFIFMFISIVFKPSSAPSFYTDINVTDYKDKYHRDIPYDGNPVDLFSILQAIYSIDYSNYITYFFLKWIKDGNLEKFNYEKGIMFKKEKTGFKIIKKPNTTSDIEESLFDFLVLASGADEMLQENEFDKWINRNTNTFRKFISNLKSDSNEKLLSKGYLIDNPDKGFLFKKEKYILTDTGKELTENLIMFKNYLEDFSLLNERDSANIHLWDNLMLYAAIYGITEVVEKEFNKLYPNYFEQTNINTTNIYLANYYARSISSSYYTASTASASRSSGFGGGTSFGGGGGGFGGGSGGGTR